MIVFGIWSKAAAEKVVALVGLMLGSMALVSCNNQEPVSVAPLALRPLPKELEQQPRPPQPDLGLISLPTVEEVQQAAQGGRANPFQPLRSGRQWRGV